MTNRVKGFLVNLEYDIREDGCEDVINALRMVKGVMSVKPYITGAEGHILYERGYHDCRQNVLNSFFKTMDESKK